MTTIRDHGLLWSDQAYLISGVITSDPVFQTPGRDSLAFTVYSTRAGSLEVLVTFTTAATARTLQTIPIAATTATRICFTDGPILPSFASGASDARVTLRFTEGGAGAGTIAVYVGAGGPTDG